MIERYDTKRHKISLHTFRSWFITKCNRIDSDFGNSLAGHAKYMKRYDRLTDKEKLVMFIKAEPTLSIFDNFDTTEYDKQLEETRKKNQDLEQQMIDMRKEIRDLLRKSKGLKSYSNFIEELLKKNNLNTHNNV